MKNAEIVLCIDPMFFGGSKMEAESFAFNMNRNIEKTFNIKCDYTLNAEGNTYKIFTNNNHMLEMDIASFIEQNWFTKNIK